MNILLATYFDCYLTVYECLHSKVCRYDIVAVDTFLHDYQLIIEGCSIELVGKPNELNRREYVVHKY